MQNSSLVYPQQNRFNDTLRQAMRTRINVILQRKGALKIRTDATTKQKLVSGLTNILEAKLMNLAKSEEEYSKSRDLEVRMHYIFKELCSSWFRAKNVSNGISALPDTLITQILLWLPTKDSVKTSVLSKRWRNLWRDVPGLELHSNDFSSYFKASAIKNFIDRFLEINHELRLEKFKINYDECNVYLFGISDLIAEVTNRGAQHLDVDTLRCPITKDFMPVDIYKSKTLVSLKLANVGMASPGFVVSLPCLKIMHLEDILYSNEDPLIIEKLLSGCPVLEDLTVCRAYDDNVPVLRVRSQTLKRFCVRSGPWRRIGGKEFAVEIDAPRLKYMIFRDDQSNRFVVKNLSSLFMIDIDTKFNVVLSTVDLGTSLQIKKGIIRDFLNGISNVRHMIISQPTLEVLFPYLKEGPIFKFRNLSRLEASLCTVLLQVLPNFLGCFPKLKHLTLYLVYLKDLEPENLELTIVPHCLLINLECVEIKEVITVEKAGMKRARNSKRTATKVLKHKKKIWIEAVRYILENSLVLKKLILCFSPITNKALDITTELLTFKKRSERCGIFIRLTSL